MTYSGEKFGRGSGPDDCAAVDREQDMESVIARKAAEEKGRTVPETVEKMQEKGVPGDCARESDFTETITIKAELKNLDQVRGLVNRAAGENCACLFKVQLAAEELFVNIASYAYRGQKQDEQEKLVELTGCRSGKWLLLTWKDYGMPFNMLEHREPKWKDSIDEQEPGGFGISLVRKVMDEVCYLRENGANILTMKKELK